ncbi:Cytochrome c2 [Mariprofundus aestuarium]|uniref:Cytochrome c2 n=1 Tax=Mariprofundus aestuarium TaxID=1921086 RepID=A0A2K8KWV3_MARES|nr:immunoglobulin-like domain-containing protein [Mariprofundus aestuarium]ATX79313.1 Cytochrome c2 [Mariprofundus aestuarium]
MGKVFVTVVSALLMFAAPTSGIAAKPDTTPPVIKLIGADTVTIQVGGNYVEAGAQAVDDVDGDISSQIRTVTTLDSAKPGTYAVAYNVSDAAGNAAAAVFRFVRVVEAVSEPAAAPASQPAVEPAPTPVTEPVTETVAEPVSEPVAEPEPAPKPVTKADTRAPVIKLKGSASVSINEGEEYSDPGATAWDMVDGNLTRRISIKGEVNTSRPATYMITYSVSDKAGNRAKSVSRFVTVIRGVDTTPPVITLNGAASASVTEDMRYVDAGATAMDGTDGNISTSIKKAGSVNTSEPGTYTLTYDVSDAAGNAANTKLRKVTVIARGDPAAGKAVAMKKCATCHNVTSTDKKFGPGLKGVFNRKAGTMDGFKYSDTLSSGNWKWDKANLNTWLSQNTSDAVKQVSGKPDARTKMKFKGITGADLDNLISFLRRNQ